MPKYNGAFYTLHRKSKKEYKERIIEGIVLSISTGENKLDEI